MFSSLSGKSVLVTGASSGIGLGIARQFAIQGARVLITARNADKIETVAAAMRADGLQVQGLAADVADSASVEALIRTLEEMYGGLDVLCCNAGIFPSSTLENLTDLQQGSSRPARRRARPRSPPGGPSEAARPHPGSGAKRDYRRTEDPGARTSTRA